MPRKPKKDADNVSAKVHEASAANAEPQKNGPEENAEEEVALPNRPNSQPMQDAATLSAERHEPSVINAEIPEHKRMARKPNKDADNVSAEVHEASAAYAEPQKMALR